MWKPQSTHKYSPRDLQIVTLTQILCTAKILTSFNLTRQSWSKPALISHSPAYCSSLLNLLAKMAS